MKLTEYVPRHPVVSYVLKSSQNSYPRLLNFVLRDHLLETYGDVAQRMG